MKAVILILYLVSSILCQSQPLTKNGVVEMVRERWLNQLYFMGDTIRFDFNLIDKSNFFQIDNKTYDSISIDKGLKNLQKRDITGIGISYKLDRTLKVPSEFKISTRTKKNQSKKQRMDIYKRTVSEFITDQYSFKDTTRHHNSKDCALIIDDEVIPPYKARAKLFSIGFDNIENIDAWGPGYEFPLYGENSKNGQVFIWTKKSLLKKSR